MSTLLDSLDRGFDTQLGNWFADGKELSGGQWQAVAASRAWMRHFADILILDEPTAAMDVEAETRLMDRLQELISDKMTILISHRLSALRRSDKILIIENGLVSECGSHADLMAKGGYYASLFNQQAAGYA